LPSRATIGLITFVSKGWPASSSSLGASLPPAPGEQPPILWGDEAHVRELFGKRVSSPGSPAGTTEAAEYHYDYLLVIARL
jgi:hypothetical protein